MQLIGITGKSGSGKTTFSNMLAENTNIGVIHTDDILREIKSRYFSMFMKKDVEGKKTKVNSKLKTILYKNKLLFELFMRLRAELIKSPLLEEIERLQAEGKETILIDDIFIKYQRIYDKLSMIFVVNRPYVQRKESIIKRDGLTLDEAVAYDVAHFKGNYKEISDKGNMIKVINNGTEEELRQKAEQIYRQYFINFRDMYKENTDNTHNLIIEDKNIDKKRSEYKDERI